MKVLIKAAHGGFVNLDNIFDIVPTFGTVSEIRAYGAFGSCNGFSEALLFRGTEDEAREWLSEFEPALLRSNPNIRVL